MDTASAPTVHLSPSPIGSRWYEKLGQLFGVDLRSLAALRISVGTIVIADLMNRATDLTAHYTDIGVLPRSALLGQFSDGTVISLHLITGQTWGQAILFALAGALALAMVVGYRARLATGLSWAMMVSLHARNQMVLDSGDALLRMLLLWLTFLPTGAVWSLDAMARPRTLATRPFVSVATLGLMLQVCLVYVISALFKDAPTWANGNALFEALQLDQFATPLGHWLLAHPGLLRVLTHWVRYLELFGPLLAFVPIFTWRIRVAIVALFWSLHAGMGLTLELGHFPYICAAAWLAFVPGEFWDRAGRWRWVIASREHLAAAWAQRRVRRLGDRLSTRPQLASVEPSMLNNVLSLLCLLYVLMWNLREYNPQEYTRFMPHRFDWVRDVFWFGQRWDMFAPRPMTFDGWHVIPARLHDGREVDLFSGGKAVTWEKPQRVSRMYANTRWRKYHLNIQFTWNSEHRGWYARYLARTWNAAHPDPGDQVESIEIDFMQQDTTPDGVRPTPRKLVLWKYSVAQ